MVAHFTEPTCLAVKQLSVAWMSKNDIYLWNVVKKNDEAASDGNTRK